MTLDAMGIERALARVLPIVPAAEIRLVGTASSALRGIKLPANDIDILFRDRVGVDEWFTALQRNDHEVETAPAWLADANQYFARIRTNGIALELSTVELDIEIDTAECFGVGPWQHFDPVSCGGGSIPAVASELRLITEIARGREDRSGPIIDFLRKTGCDVPLVRRGLSNLDATPDAINRVMAELSADGASADAFPDA